ncbi:hypothetical protein [Roseobacter litoralis]|uniref:Uncharacterized protein n=1 Tax=Roseobacter litoralis (strain ATCC 49566 / DSM 6996 / JCM 21268 / NBRC 15278 / OCh 149) TaxID=391595 RepID=F7ZI92_ROSLO|nr:hypothetical protein [Roseobacter litoralis]AEI96228.1 hypothetical protein RLO149_c043320 [Roseobacter litoralis Och 149]
MKNFALTAAAVVQVKTSTVPFDNEGATLPGTRYLPEVHDGSFLSAGVVTGTIPAYESRRNNPGWVG